MTDRQRTARPRQPRNVAIGDGGEGVSDGLGRRGGGHPVDEGGAEPEAVVVAVDRPDEQLGHRPSHGLDRLTDRGETGVRGDLDVVEAVDNGPSLLRALTNHRPDVAVVDASWHMPNAARNAQGVHVLFNNCYANYGATNAIEFSS